jgi:NADPH:quinone reductase-like Zn-dependent oxidoreductase
MKAIVQYSYGSLDGLRCEDIETPAPGDRQLLVRVRAASVNPLDCATVKGIPYIFRKLFRVRQPTAADPGRPGVDLAGVVEAVGSSVTQFKPGDEVFGLCTRDRTATGAKAWAHRQGAFAEYACVSESILAIKPDNVTFEQAASVPVAAFTALQGLRDKGRMKAGQKVLINGAAGGVGTFGVQIAKAFGAEVTGICSTRNVEMVRSTGADHVIDYTQENFTTAAKRYDIILDCASRHSPREIRRVLAPNGRCVMVGDMTGRGPLGIIGRLIAALGLSAFGSRKFVMFMAKPKKDDLVAMHDLMKAGRVIPVIDRMYPLSEVAQAIQYVSEKHARGKVVITVEAEERLASSAPK